MVPGGAVADPADAARGAGVILAFLLLGSEPGGLPGFIEAHLREGLTELGLLDESSPSPDLARLAAVIPGSPPARRCSW